jgi:hypothetical protein
MRRYLDLAKFAFGGVTVDKAIFHLRDLRFDAALEQSF